MTPDETSQIALTLATLTAVQTAKLDKVIEAVTRIDERVSVLPKLTEKVEKHSSQISYWRGAIAIVAFIIVVFGVTLVTLVAHAVGGK
jgi:quinol-cytochrome oxidoreductase complex cytochrome b subunit